MAACERGWTGPITTMGAELDTALALAREERFEEALEAFDRAVRAAPGDAEAWSHRAACLVKLARLEEAELSLQRALAAAAAREAELHRRRGNVLIRLGRHAEAQAALTRATDLAPESAEAWYDRGVCLLEMALAPDAAEAFGMATRLDPTFANGWSNLGVALARGGLLDEAIDALAQAVAADPNDPDGWFEDGVCLGERQRYEEARGAYQGGRGPGGGEAGVAYAPAPKLRGDAAGGWNTLAAALHELGQLDEARAAYDSALALD